MATDAPKNRRRRAKTVYALLLIANMLALMFSGIMLASSFLIWFDWIQQLLMVAICGVALAVMIGLLVGTIIFWRRYREIVSDTARLFLTLAISFAIAAEIATLVGLRWGQEHLLKERFKETYLIHTSGLHDALNAGDAEGVKAILDRNKDLIHQSDYHGLEPLLIAAKRGDIRMVNLLFTYGADPNDHNRYGMTALHWVAKSGHVEIARILMDKGAWVNEEDADGKTPLVYAKASGNEEMVNLLLERGGRLVD